MIAAGLLAGLASFGIGEAAPELVAPSLEFTPEQRANRNQLPAVIGARFRQSRTAPRPSLTGRWGCSWAWAWGRRGGLARGSATAAAAAGLAGLVLGGAAGAGVTTLALPAYHAARTAATDEDVTRDLGLALATHGGIWIAVGAAAGLALGLGLGGGARLARAIVGGVLGAVLAAVIYEFGGAVGFPLSETFRPRAVTAGPRLMAHLSVALCVSAAALWAVRYLSLGRSAARPIVKRRPADRALLSSSGSFASLANQVCSVARSLGNSLDRSSNSPTASGRVVVFVEQALDQEHPREAAEGIKADRLARLPKADFPVLLLHFDVGQALVQARRPWVQGHGPAGVFAGGPKIAELDRVLDALFEHLLVVGGRPQDKLVEPDRLGELPLDRQSPRAHPLEEEVLRPPFRRPIEQGQGQVAQPFPLEGVPERFRLEGEGAAQLAVQRLDLARSERVAVQENQVDPGAAARSDTSAGSVSGVFKIRWSVTAMWAISVPESGRHVTTDAVVVGAPRQARGDGQAASLLRVAIETSLAVERDLHFGCGDSVRIVARRASELALAGAIAAARLHLLDVTHGLVSRTCSHCR